MGLSRSRTTTAPVHVTPDTTPADGRFHLHFGAGRLGLGLVIPAVAAQGIPFGVVQRPKPTWEEIWQGEAEPRLTVNDDVAVDAMQALAGGKDTDAERAAERAMIFGSTVEELSVAVGKPMPKLLVCTLVPMHPPNPASVAPNCANCSHTLLVNARAA